MLWVKVLLEIDGVVVEIMFVEGVEEGFLKDFDLQELIHGAVNMMKFSNPIPSHTPPYHYIAAAMLQFLLCVSCLMCFPWSAPTPFSAI